MASVAQSSQVSTRQDQSCTTKGDQAQVKDSQFSLETIKHLLLCIYQEDEVEGEFLNSLLGGIIDIPTKSHVDRADVFPIKTQSSSLDNSFLGDSDEKRTKKDQPDQQPKSSEPLVDSRKDNGVEFKKVKAKKTKRKTSIEPQQQKDNKLAMAWKKYIHIGKRLRLLHGECNPRDLGYSVVNKSDFLNKFLIFYEKVEMLSGILDGDDIFSLLNEFDDEYDLSSELVRAVTNCAHLLKDGEYIVSDYKNLKQNPIQDSDTRRKHINDIFTDVQFYFRYGIRYWIKTDKPIPDNLMDIRKPPGYKKRRQNNELYGEDSSDYSQSDSDSDS